MLGLGRRFRRFSRASGPTRPGPSGLGVAVMLLTVLAGVAPLFAGPATPTVVGLALLVGACLELAHGVRRSTPEGRRAAWIGGAITLAMSVVVLQAGDLAGRAILVLLAVWFGVDALRYAVGRGGEPGPWLRARALPALGYGLAGGPAAPGSRIRRPVGDRRRWRFPPRGHGVEHRHDAGLHARRHRGHGRAGPGSGRQPGPRGPGPPYRDRGAGPSRDRPRLDRRLRGDAVRHSPRPHGTGPVHARDPVALRGRPGRSRPRPHHRVRGRDPGPPVHPARHPAARAARVGVVPRTPAARGWLRAVVRGWLDHRLRFAVRLRAARYSICPRR